MAKVINVGIIGTGFIGPAHLEAVRRLGDVQVLGVAEHNQELADQKAALFNIPRAYGNYLDMINDKEIHVIHNCTPNRMHYEVNKRILEAGKHVVSEKPLTDNSTESRKLVQQAAKSGLVNAVNYNYRYFPMVQQTAAMMGKGKFGELIAIQGTYCQDWLLYDTDWNWRLDAKQAGPSCALADIGSHWLDLVQFITGKEIVRVFSDMMTVHEIRKRPKQRIETFAGKKLKPSDYEEVKVEVDNYDQVLVEFAGGGRGMVCVSQVSAGRKNHLTFELCGTAQAAWWDQERPNELYLGRRNEPNELMLKDPSLLDPSAKDYAHYPGGHQEGYPDCLKNFFRNVYRYIRNPRGKIDFATFDDGHRAVCIVEAALKSNKMKKWVDVKY